MQVRITQQNCQYGKVDEIVDLDDKLAKALIGGGRAVPSPPRVATEKAEGKRTTKKKSTKDASVSGPDPDDTTGDGGADAG